MNGQEIIEMARQAGSIDSEDVILTVYNAFAAKEREACAKVCEELQAPPHVSMSDVSMWDVTSMECADAIRARGKA